MSKQLGPYLLQERLGVGGMAEVFFAHARRQGDFVQPCVVKVLHSELADDRNFTRMLLEEARLIAKLRHNNIAGLYDVGREEGNVFLVMEYVQGRDLHDVLSKSARAGRQLPIDFALHVARHICAGLHFAHTRKGPDGAPLNLVHRDISPPNVLISALGEVKVIDFGVAKFSSEAREKTKAGIIKGKFGYMAPEQAWDEELDRRSDVFAVGICLYEMLTGRSLYGHSDDAMTMLKRAREADIDPVSDWRDDVPDELAAIVHRALERNRDQRYQCAHSMERQLAELLSQISPDYTNLDAGAVIDELFDLDDPALESVSPRIDDSTREPKRPTPPPGISKAKRDVAESTKPMADVPDDVRKSGAHGRVKGDDAADDATLNITFAESELSAKDADFSAEETELFDEERVSGAHPAVPRGMEAAPRTQLLDTRAAKQEETEPEHSSLDDHPTDPTHKAIDEPTERRTLSRRQSARVSGSFGAESRNLDDVAEAPTKAMKQRVQRRELRSEAPSDAQPEAPTTEARQRNAVKSTSKQDAIDSDSRRSKPSAAPSMTTAAADKNEEDEGIDRRIQIAGAAAFVLLALLFVASRIL